MKVEGIFGVMDAEVDFEDDGMDITIFDKFGGPNTEPAAVGLTLSVEDAVRLAKAILATYRPEQFSSDLTALKKHA